MTSSSFNGAIDLSGLKAKAQAGGAGAQPSHVGGSSYVVDITQANLQQMLGESVKYPVILEFWSPRAQGADEMSGALANMANSSAGKFLLGRINVDAEAQIAQALSVQAVPTVVAVIGGQVAPLFQGTQPVEQVRAIVDQVLQAAVANGIVGTAPPQAGGAGSAAGGGGAGAEGSDGANPPADPRFEAADTALAAGDYAAAEAEFDKIIAESPNDAEAKAGKAQAGLLARAAQSQDQSDGDPSAVIGKANAAPDDLDAQLAAADLEVIGGNPEAGFGRLIAAVRRTVGAERDRVRQRLLELFETVDPKDPAVLKARRDLMTALF